MNVFKINVTTSDEGQNTTNKHFYPENKLSKQSGVSKIFLSKSTYFTKIYKNEC